MTNEEAIKILKEPCKDCDCHWEYGSEKCKMHDCYTALEMAIEALDKRVAKKPEQRNEMDFCPNCGHWLDELYDVLFCPDCGQKIDWS